MLKGLKHTQRTEINAMASILVRITRKDDQAAIELAWKEEKQRIKSDGSGSQSYSTIEPGQE